MNTKESGLKNVKSCRCLHLIGIHIHEFFFYAFMLIKCNAHVLWDMFVLAELQLMTYIRVVGTKHKHISDV